jgi:hypothetical protein
MPEKPGSGGIIKDRPSRPKFFGFDMGLSSARKRDKEKRSIGERQSGAHPG